MCEAINAIKVMNMSITPKSLLVPHFNPASLCSPFHAQANTGLLSVTMN